MALLLAYILSAVFFWTATVLIIVALLAVVGAVIFRRRVPRAEPRPRTPTSARDEDL
jgi:membrane protein implicated in regulation of membrane protease activity